MLDTGIEINTTVFRAFHQQNLVSKEVYEDK
jgi:hypothetical protein